MKKILISLSIIAAVGAVVVGATTAFLSDTETSTGNTFSQGTIDISVDDQNPWTGSWENYLDKPSQTNYMNFVIENVGENPANVWKRLTNVVNDGGIPTYPEGTPICSSEPEYTEGGGEFDNGIPTGVGYVERDNLSAFIIYDMYVCRVGTAEVLEQVCSFIDDGYGNIKKPDLASGQWTTIIDEIAQVRVDNISDTWIKLVEDLLPEEKLVVSQSYHLMTWDDSGQPIITNWAQGDTMTFDVELDARQTDAPAPGTTQQDGEVVATINLVERDPISWEIIPGTSGTLTYDVSGPSFDYDLNVNGLSNDTPYCLIYYADPWPGDGPAHGAGALLGKHTSDGAGTINVITQSTVFASPFDIPMADDNNYPAGAKVWLVPCTDYSTVTVGTNPANLTAWNPTTYLFDDGLVNYTYAP